MLELQELSLGDGRDVYDMLREIGPGEHGFVNEDPGEDFARFPDFLNTRHDWANGINLKPHWVPHTTYWLLVDSRPVGIGRLRHYLNDYLRTTGGHIGYEIRPSERGQGYGTRILAELLKQAAVKGIPDVLITCDEDNVRSRRVLAANQCELFEIKERECYWRKGLNDAGRLT